MEIKFTSKFNDNLQEFCDYMAGFHLNDPNYSSKLRDAILKYLGNPKARYNEAHYCDSKTLGKVPSGSGAETPENKKLKKFEITKFPKASGKFYKPKNPLARIYY